MKRSLANRLKKLASEDVATAREKELQLFDRLVELGYAASEQVGSDYGYLYTRYRITPEGRRALARA